MKKKMKEVKEKKVRTNLESVKLQITRNDLVEFLKLVNKVSQFDHEKFTDNKNHDNLLANYPVVIKLDKPNKVDASAPSIRNFSLEF
jgi:retron-type reverse transcriptase